MDRKLFEILIFLVSCQNTEHFKLLGCLCHSVLHHHHEPPDWPGCQWHQDPDWERQQKIRHLTNSAGQWYDGPEVYSHLQILCPCIFKRTVWGVHSSRTGYCLFSTHLLFSGFWVRRKTLGSWHFLSMIQKIESWKNGSMIIVSGKSSLFKN